LYYHIHQKVCLGQKYGHSILNECPTTQNQSEHAQLLGNKHKKALQVKELTRHAVSCLHWIHRNKTRMLGGSVTLWISFFF